MKLGVCYYPEHWPESRWALDAKLLREAGLTLARMCDFAWSKLEPRPGEFDFAWLDRAIATFERENISVVLATPTAGPPAWLSRTYPETLPVDAQGRVKNFGGRRHYCPNSAVYRDLSARIVTHMAELYGADARVIGWQIDNEFGEGNTTRCYCPNCAAAFRVWLASHYKSISELNDAWGSAFWSQDYSDWSQINPPNLLGCHSPNPSHALDYYRFASDSFRDFQQIQMNVLRGILPENRFITHNFMGLFPELDAYALAEPLSFVAWDSYPTGHTEYGARVLAHADDGTYGYDTGNPYLVDFEHAIVRGSKNGLPFWIMEQQAGNVNWGTYNPSPRPGVMHLWLWHNFFAGASTTVLFRERATHLAQEQYHSGLLAHDGSLAQGYLDLASFSEQLALMQSLENSRVQNDVALLISYEDLWAIELQPHNQDFNYWNVIFTWHAALLRAGVPCDVVSQDADLAAYKLVIAPCLHLAGESLAAHLTAYVESGGMLVLGIRSGFKTPTNLVTADPLPGALRSLVGATVTGWQSLPPNVTLPVALMWRGWQHVNASRWIETLNVESDTAGVIATYVGATSHSPQLEGRAAMTVNQVGAGRVFYCGWLPDQSQADALIGMLLPEAQVTPLGIVPHGVLVGRRIQNDKTYWGLLNFTDEEKRVWLNPGEWHDASGSIPLTNEVTLPPRTTRVLVRASSTTGRLDPKGFRQMPAL